MRVASHHFIGTGMVSARLAREAREPDRLIGCISERVTAANLEVVAHQVVAFDNGGQTFVWVLAESHLVLHHWAEEHIATIDLHVCDYRRSNARNARNLVEALKDFCFVAGSDSWRELELESPRRTATAAIR